MAESSVPGAVGEPRTEAGRALMESLQSVRLGRWDRAFAIADILAIEREAGGAVGEREEPLDVAFERLRRAYRAVHTSYDGECEHGFGPPATLCTNAVCEDKELAEAWVALTAAIGRADEAVALLTAIVSTWDAQAEDTIGENVLALTPLIVRARLSVNEGRPVARTEAEPHE